MIEWNAYRALLISLIYEAIARIGRIRDNQETA